MPTGFNDAPIIRPGKVSAATRIVESLTSFNDAPIIRPGKGPT